MFVLQPRLHRVCQIACVQFVRYINNQSKNSVTLDRDKLSDAGQLVCVRRCWPPHRTKRLRSYESNFLEKTSCGRPDHCPKVSAQLPRTILQRPVCQRVSVCTLKSFNMTSQCCNAVLMAQIYRENTFRAFALSKPIMKANLNIKLLVGN